MKTIDRSRLQSLMQREQRRFVDERPKSKALFERARKSLLGGVPMNWMAKWAGAFPPFVREAQGAHFYDVDGHRYVDLCLGDTGAMTGHSPSATVKAVEEQVRRGITLMLPNEDAVFVGEELQKRFGLPYWQFGTLVIIDETHTICAGPGGYTRAENLEPDFLVFGKPIGSGVPGAVYGFTQEIAEKIAERQNLEDCDVGGVGGTLAGNALSLAAMRATLSKVLTKEAFEHMIPMAERWTEGVRTAIAEFAVPWHVTRLGCRAEYLFSLEAPKNGTQAHDAMDFELERFMHLYAMNRGILLTPFHNMALMSPQTEAEDIDKHTRVFREGLKELVS